MVGWYLGTSPSGGGLALLEKRNPAGISSVYDFSRLDGEELEEKSKYRLFEEVKIFSSGESVGIEIGNFVVKGQDNVPEFACGYYSEVSLVFRADGMASNGQVPEMTIKDTCYVASNVNRLRPFWIPLKRILSERPGDADFQYQDFSPVSMRNIGEEWPKNWYLHSVKLNNPEFSDRQIEADHVVSGKGPIYRIDL